MHLYETSLVYGNVKQGVKGMVHWSITKDDYRYL